MATGRSTAGRSAAWSRGTTRSRPLPRTTVAARGMHGARVRGSSHRRPSVFETSGGGFGAGNGCRGALASPPHRVELALGVLERRGRVLHGLLGGAHLLGGP